MFFNLTLNTTEPESSKGSELSSVLHALAAKLESDHPVIDEEQGDVIFNAAGAIVGKWSIVDDPQSELEAELAVGSETTDLVLATAL